MFKSLIPALSLLCCLALPASAQNAAQKPATGDILTGWQQPDGTRVAALRIKMAPGWKTYWRSPGDAGIPPQFDWSRSRNLRGVGITWPAPQVYPQSGLRTIGYKDQLILPLRIAPRNPDKPVQLRVALDIGVCKDICVPYQLSLKSTLDSTTSQPTPAIAAALAARPFTAREGGVSAATCALRPAKDGFKIETRLKMPAVGKREVVIIEPGQPGIWASETKTRRSGKVLTATGELVPGRGMAMAIDRSAIVITVLGGAQAVEIKGCDPA